MAGGQISSIESHPLGDLLILANASSYAGYLVLVQPLMKRYTPLDVIQWVFFFGLIIVLPFGQGFLRVEWTELAHPYCRQDRIRGGRYYIFGSTCSIYLPSLWLEAEQWDSFNDLSPTASHRFLRLF